jgi:hypothetical protein
MGSPTHSDFIWYIYAPSLDFQGKGTTLDTRIKEDRMTQSQAVKDALADAATLRRYAHEHVGPETVELFFIGSWGPGSAAWLNAIADARAAFRAVPALRGEDGAQ